MAVKRTKKFFGGYLEQHECDWMDQAGQRGGFDTRTDLLRWFARNCEELVPGTAKEEVLAERKQISKEERSLLDWLEGEIDNDDDFSKACQQIARRLGWDPGDR